MNIIVSAEVISLIVYRIRLNIVDSEFGSIFFFFGPKSTQYLFGKIQNIGVWEKHSHLVTNNVDASE